jgi:hypothetical protein
MDDETVDATAFGRSLRGIGPNLVVRDMARSVAFLAGWFEMAAFRVSRDFAIQHYGGQVFQLHADPTFAAHPLAALLPEAGARGAGIELRLFDTDSDGAAARAPAVGGIVLQPPPTSRTACARR